MSEMQKLKALLKNARIPFQITHGITPRQKVLCYPRNKGMESDALCYPMNTKEKNSLLECTWLSKSEQNEDDKSECFLSAQEVFERIKKHYEAQQITGAH